MSATLEAPSTAPAPAPAQLPPPPDDEHVFGAAIPALGPRLAIVRGVAVTVGIVAVALLLHLFVIGPAEHWSTQHRLHDELREQLATGTAPIGPTDNEQRELHRGAPVAMLEIPAIELTEVAVEGTGADELYGAPGHRRDTPLPGQPGTSVIMGRRSTFGAPFARIDDLEPGDSVLATTGQGSFEYAVVGVRRAGDPLPPPLEPTWSRITLITAGGSRFVPSGIVRVDADLIGYSVGAPARIVATSELPSQELPMASDGRDLWKLILWLQAVLLAVIGFEWAWHRWGRAQAWIVFAPLMSLAGLAASGEILQLLPNVF